MSMVCPAIMALARFISLQKLKAIPISNIRNIQSVCHELDDDLRWLIGLISDTGARLSEVAGLLVTDINIEAKYPHIIVQPHPWRSLKTKSSKRSIPLIGTALWAAQRIKKGHESVFAFPRYSNEQNCNANSASAALNKWLKSYVPNGCVIHSFRHSFRDRLRNAGVQSEMIDQLGGWSNKTVGQGYGMGYDLGKLSINLTDFMS